MSESIRTTPTTSFPTLRLRRLRRTESLRALVRETSLEPSDLIYPFFVTHGSGVRNPVGSMPGVFQLSVDQLPREVADLSAHGIRAALIFGLPARKDERGSEAYDSDGIVQRAVRSIKDVAPDLVVITDVCLCEYTSHGHCGIVENGSILNDSSLELLAQTALTQAQAGADIVAPSDMMDGRVAAIRRTLDESSLENTAVMAYSAKFASAFYGPFREAAESTPQFGDRRSYQMDPPNAREALREMELDLAEGADILMVKPALAYLDLIRRARERFGHPLAAYNVSGEYAMVKAAAQFGWIDERSVVLEILTGIKRAGADLIISYHARDASEWITE